jgi:alkylhydroperoxidase family enzyme
MARLLHEIDWAEPVFPLPDDPGWAHEVEAAVGDSLACYVYAAPSPWLRKGLLQSAQLRYPHLGMSTAWLAILVTSQENACRYCYGSARAYLKLLGLSESRIDEVEREVQAAGVDPSERELLQFCRNLSRSKPRPSRTSVDALLEIGYTPVQIEEIASAVVSACHTNRFATFVAAPLISAEERVERPIFRLLRPLLARLNPYPRPLPAREVPESTGPYGELVSLVAHTEFGPILHDMLEGALHSEVLSRRTVGWMFAVVATALECKLCRQGSRVLLGEEGVSADRFEGTLQTLAGAQLNEVETLLLPWVRETVHYETETIQRRTHELARQVDPRVLLEAIGVASLANACSRLSLLAP